MFDLMGSGKVKELQEEKKSIKRLFDQTARAFVTAVEQRDPFSQGHSARTADYARRIAAAAGKTEDECDAVYYSALLHDVGMIGIPDSLIAKTGGLSDEERQILRKKPIYSSEILSSIREYPYLREDALHSHERYNGEGYPSGLKGKEIPETARIIAVADAYDTMISPQRFRDPLPYQYVREEFIKESGGQFDPDFARIMVQIIDEDHAEHEQQVIKQAEEELLCREYRDKVSVGISITRDVKRLRFTATPQDAPDGGFSAPSIILFDAIDRHVHTDPESIEAYQYMEYGEVWFDGHFVSTAARNIEATPMESMAAAAAEDMEQAGQLAVYDITAMRYEDHVSLKMIGPTHVTDVIVALPNKTKACYIGLTGENCHIKDVSIQKTGERVKEGDIRKIAAEISYLGRMESDLPNLQIDRTRSAHTIGKPISDGLRIEFHTMSLPTANLVWHCPYVVLFSSNDKTVGGAGYREYAVIKLSGEGSMSNEFAENHFTMKKRADFPGWDEWKKHNLEGMECLVECFKRGDKIMVRAENLGIEIEHTTELKGAYGEVCVSLTGDQVVLTDIRIN
ncbi:MAG: HD domain-containing protein [Lachnospiraceae bacterium]|nr:HD domain-containing protein [Lachnospiraceae bacterium]